MVYSCFNQQLGLYEYFEDDRSHPFNGDLPVPTHPRVAGRVGVPATEAGRRLPADTTRVGSGFAARGIIVQCKNTPMAGLEGAALSALPASPALSDLPTASESESWVRGAVFGGLVGAGLCYLFWKN